MTIRRGHSVTWLSSGTPVVFEETRALTLGMTNRVMIDWSTETREILGSGFKSR